MFQVRLHGKKENFIENNFQYRSEFLNFFRFKLEHFLLDEKVLITYESEQLFQPF